MFVLKNLQFVGGFAHSSQKCMTKKEDTMCQNNKIKHFATLVILDCFEGTAKIILLCLY